MATVTTPAQICNVALLRVGQRQLVDSLDDKSLQAQTCKAIYAATRDGLLEKFSWPFATARATLALTSSTRSGWAYTYRQPPNCLKPRYIWPGTRAPQAASRIPFAQELDDNASGFLICTDQAQPELVYTAQIAIEALFPALFVQALAWALAVELCLSLPIKPQVALAMQTGLRQAQAEAIASSARVGQEDPEPDSEFVTIRG